MLCHVRPRLVFGAFIVLFSHAIVCQDATLELKVKTVKYFKGLMRVHEELGVDLTTAITPVQKAD